jgi:predicted DsbA family dithiol-disulfide isomerase
VSAVAPGRIVVWSDLACPWAHVAVARLHRVRDELGLSGEVVFDHRAFPLEIMNGQPTPKRVLDAELAVTGTLEPGAGWQMWQGDEHAWPVTTLPALEAVQAAKEQSLEASEALDRALRVAMFGQSRCISLRHVILDVAGSCPSVDADGLAEALDDGRARRALTDQCQEATGDQVKGSPHLFLPDGTDVHNPGVAMRWEGEKGKGFPVVESDDASVYADLLTRAASQPAA